MNKLRNIDKRAVIPALVFALLFGGAYAIGENIVFCGNVAAEPTENYMTMPGVRDALIFAVAAFAAFALMLLLYSLCTRLEAGEGENRHEKLFAFIIFAFIFLAWLPVFLSCYPGIIQGDSICSIEEMLEYGHPASNHHPVVYTLLIGFFLKLGELFSSRTLGIALYSLFQMLVMDFTLVRLLTVLRRRGVNTWLLCAFALFFALSPFVSSYSVVLWKDPLYSCALLHLSIELMGETRSGKSLLRIVLLCAAASFMRNNGIYVVLVLAVILVIKNRKRRLVTAASFAAFIALYFVITSYGYKAWEIDKPFEESVGVPLQQIGAIVYYDGGLSESEKEYLFELMDEYWWEENYSPCLADTIKWSFYFNSDVLDEAKPEFLRAWFGAVLHNPVTAVRAYLMNTHGFWKVGAYNGYGGLGFNLGDDPDTAGYEIAQRDIIFGKTGFSLKSYMKENSGGISSGTLLWLCLAGFTLCLMKKRPYWLCYVPALANWGFVMIATPVAYSLRYVYIFLLALPLFVLLPFISGGTEAETQGRGVLIQKEK